MGGIFTSLFGKKLTPTSSKGRAWNTIKVHYRGLFGVIPPLIVLILLLDPAKPYKTVGGICFWMLWFLLLQPIPPNAVGIIPLFAFPFFGIMDTETTIKCYINETIIFFFLSGWLLMTLNCAGLDKRIVCFIFKIGGEKKFGAFPTGFNISITGAVTLWINFISVFAGLNIFNPRDLGVNVSLLMKATMSSFLISMLSCRTSALPNMYDIIMPPLLKLQTSSSGEINYTKFNAILCNAITTSSIIGSMCIIHASVTTLQFKSLFVEIGDPSDFFNYLQFGAFAIPVGVAMLLWNTIYHFALIKLFVENKNKKMSQYSMKAISTAVTDSKKELGKMTFHRWIASVLLLLCFVVFLTRWSTWLGNGWSSADMFELDVKDATPAACFVLIFFVVPKTFNFLKIFTVKEEKDAPLKMESGVLFWKYVDKNLDYSYFIIFGGGLAVFKAVQVSGMPAALVDDVAAFTKFDWNLAIFIIVATSVFLANITSGVGAQAMLTPMFHALTATGSSPYPVKQHLIALGIGLASGFGMVSRFRDTPGYFTGTKGNVKLINQIRYGIGSTLICAIVLTLALCFYGPALWEVVIVVEKAPEATEAPGPQ